MIDQENPADSLGAARGMIFAIVISVPLWLAVGLLAWWLS